MRFGVCAVFTAMLLFALHTLVSAQSTTTSLRGTVYDAKGAVVSDAALSLTNVATGFSRTANSDDHGTYQFLELPPATYQLTVNAAGFAAVKETGIELLVNTPGTVNVTMQVSGGTVTLEVSGSAPMVDTEDAAMGHAFNSDQISNLPFEGRDPTGILSLQPGVVFTGNSSRIARGSCRSSNAVSGSKLPSDFDIFFPSKFSIAPCTQWFAMCSCGGISASLCAISFS